MREVEEETGLAVTDVRVGTTLNAVSEQDGYHYVNIIVVCKTSGEPVNKEPNKCAGWDWYDWDSKDADSPGAQPGRFPSPVFLPLKRIRAMSFNPFGSHPQCIARVTIAS